MSWALIDARWDAFRAAFENFEVRLIVTYGEGDVERIMAADGVIHSRAKIAGTIANARALHALAAEYGDVGNYGRSFASYEALYADAKGASRTSAISAVTTGSSAPAYRSRASSAGWSGKTAIIRGCAR